MNKFVTFVCVSFLIALTEGVLCPDKKFRCPSGQTCCSDLKGHYGCCPYDNAVCCKDGRHCCPHGLVCDVTYTKCRTRPRVQGWTMIYEGFSNEDQDQHQDDYQGNQLGSSGFFNATLGDGLDGQLLLNKKCPDGEKSCPDKYTCCNLATGGYGCCPFKNATCCADQVHCCPNGQKCNGKTNSCD